MHCCGCMIFFHFSKGFLPSKDVQNRVSNCRFIAYIEFLVVGGDRWWVALCGWVVVYAGKGGGAKNQKV